MLTHPGQWARTETNLTAGCRSAERVLKSLKTNKKKQAKFLWLLQRKPCRKKHIPLDDAGSSKPSVF